MIEQKGYMVPDTELGNRKSDLSQSIFANWTFPKEE